jgi:hypothetical protein
MPARTSLRTSARALAPVLGLVAAIACTVGATSPAMAQGAMLTSSTKLGNDGHPYHWQAPC